MPTTPEGRQYVYVLNRRVVTNDDPYDYADAEEIVSAYLDLDQAAAALLKPEPEYGTTHWLNIFPVGEEVYGDGAVVVYRGGRPNDFFCYRCPLKLSTDRVMDDGSPDFIRRTVLELLGGEAYGPAPN